MPITWELRDEDRELFANELDDFVPDRVYDAHAHLYRELSWLGEAPAHVSAGPSDVSLETYREQMDWIVPGREVHGLHFPFPPGDGNMDNDAANEWVSEQVRKDPLARGQFLVRPTDDPEWVRDEVRRLGLRGLKPFASYSGVEPVGEAQLPSYLPESLVAVANDEEWSITIHLVRPRGVADPSNVHWLRTYCERYPRANLILDHSARGFNPYHAIEGLQQLTGYSNLWIDTSVACPPLATIAALRCLGPRRVLYGSDFFCSHIRGTNVGLNDGFAWLDEDLSVWEGNPWIPTMRPVLVGLENLRAVKAAFWALGMSDSEIERDFRGNAAELLRL